MSTQKIKPGEVIGSALEIYREQATGLDGNGRSQALTRIPDN
jgi:hypothetical protein